MLTLKNLRLNPAKAGIYLLENIGQARELAVQGLYNVPGTTVEFDNKNEIYFVDDLVCIGAICALAYLLALQTP